MSFSALALGRSFSDPILGPQIVFRTVMEALSRPGLSYTLPDLGIKGPEIVYPSALSILLSLCDTDTPVWIDQELQATDLQIWLQFHCNCPFVSDPSQAHFALYRSTLHCPHLNEFALGDPRYPERSTTILVLVDSMFGGPVLRLSGPGVLDTVEIQPLGLPGNFVEQFSSQHTLFPLGVDCLLIAQDRIVGLPRTINIQRKSL
jgi:alpha-D-ribose 1-methylphosphonate 5-triphosphate synthase subunit PhnH